MSGFRSVLLRKLNAQQKQDNITLLIDLLDKPDFYERLYALKLLIAILKNRPERTRECIYTAPFGISRLVATLDDRREIIRNGEDELMHKHPITTQAELLRP